MRLPGAARLGEGLRRARSRFLRGGAILGYHRVADSASDPFQLCVAPDHFAQQLEVLRRTARCVTLGALAHGVWDRADLRDTVAVTFDDGYADNLHAAKPALERHDVPATVHVVAGRLGRRFWWDELASQIADRRRLFRAYRRLLHVPSDLRRRVIEELPAGSRNGGGAPPKALTADELVELAEGGLVSIGAHSVTHPVLSGLTAEEQRREIERSKSQLEEIVGQAIEAFSYPHGAATEETQALVCQAGFRWASSSWVDVVTPSSDPYLLPRLWVPDVDGERFERWLGRWLPR